ncbi:MAG: hypothetical protein AABY86_07070 [Bdellovibrionota bacterium]
MSLTYMPRQPLIRSDHHPYHITQRSNNKEWFYLPMHDLWKIFQAALKDAQIGTNVQIHSFVLMHNHYHSLITTPQANIDLFQWTFANAFTRAVQAETGRINHIFGGRYKWNLIEDQKYFYQAYKYLYLNPVRAGLCKSVIDYPFSSLSVCRSLKITDPIISQHGREKIISWIDNSFSTEQMQCLKRSFVKKRFQIAVDPIKRKYLTFLNP